MTILGDLAQASAPGGQTRWADAIEALETPDAHFEELTVGYRVPAPILDLANRLLPAAAPDVRPTTSARTDGPAPRLVATTDGQLAQTIAREATELAARWTTTAIVAPARLHTTIVEGLAAAGVEFTDGIKLSELGEHVTLLTPASTKGLEFDAVLAVEPSQIVEDEVQGLRLLYIVLTRAVQELTIVHTGALPDALAD